MGALFARDFARLGKVVTVIGPHAAKVRRVARAIGVRAGRGIEDALSADLMVVCAPLDREVGVLEQIARAAALPEIVAEIGSIKSPLVPALRNVARRGVTVLSIHPLFGPGAKTWRGQRMPLVPIARPAVELRLARAIFHGAAIEPLSASRHDSIMARVLAAAHAVNVIFAAGLGVPDAAALDRFGGPVYRLQRRLSAAVLSEDPKFYALLQTMNPSAAPVLERMRDALTAWASAARRRDEAALVRIFRRASRIHRGREADYRKMYDLIRSL